MTPRSQVYAIGAPTPKTWDDYEHGCLMTFGGGYQTDEERSIFHHGITTVFNLLRAEFPPAEQIKFGAPESVNAELLQAVREDLAELIGGSERFDGDWLRSRESLIARASALPGGDLERMRAAIEEVSELIDTEAARLQAEHLSSSAAGLLWWRDKLQASLEGQ